MFSALLGCLSFRRAPPHPHGPVAVPAANRTGETLKLDGKQLDSGVARDIQLVQKHTVVELEVTSKDTSKMETFEFSIDKKPLPDVRPPQQTFPKLWHDVERWEQKNTFIFYAVVASVLALHDDRVQLKEKVVDASEILSVIRDIPHLEEFVNALYECRYADFFRAMVALEPRIATDRFLGPHANYVVRELRVLAYKQFLESYRSVTIASMARSFGVSAAFIDSEVSRFIAAGRLSAKIDKTGEDGDASAGGVIETSRPDNRNAAYQSIVKEGDALLNRVQKLTRMINI